MTLVLLDPTGRVDVGQRRPERGIATLQGKRIGFIFNQHVSAIAFWKGLEEALEEGVRPAGVHRIYKSNTWAPAPRAEVEALIAQTDLAVVGVGA